MENAAIFSTVNLVDGGTAAVNTSLVEFMLRITVEDMPATRMHFKSGAELVVHETPEQVSAAFMVATAEFTKAMIGPMMDSLKNIDGLDGFL